MNLPVCFPGSYYSAQLIYCVSIYLGEDSDLNWAYWM